MRVNSYKIIKNEDCFFKIAYFLLESKLLITVGFIVAITSFCVIIFLGKITLLAMLFFVPICTILFLSKNKIRDIVFFTLGIIIFIFVIFILKNQDLETKAIFFYLATVLWIYPIIKIN